MTAYMVVFAKVKNRERFIADYGRHAASLITEFGGEYLIRTPLVSLLEGDFGRENSAVISKWPDRKAAERFWNSDEYRVLKDARKELADCHVLLLETPT